MKSEADFSWVEPLKQTIWTFLTFGQNAGSKPVRVRLSSQLTGELIHRLLAGELEVAAVLFPEGKAAPLPLGSGRRLRICLTA